jgi:HK97 family phage major capsid protein
MTIDQKGLALLIQEASTLSRKARLTVQEERRNAWLLSSISVLKQGGITLADLDQQDLNERSVKAGLEPVQLPKGLNEAEQRATAFAGFIRGEKRTMTIGNLAAQIGTYTSLGYFIPADFFPTLFRALKAHDCLFDENSCTLIKSSNGRPLPVPLSSDVEHTASVIGEAGSRTVVDISSISHATLGAYSYASDGYLASTEAFQDVSSALSLSGIMETFFQDKLARGIGADLVNGTGGGEKPLGLVPSLEALGAPIVTANGSSGNDGGSSTNANSLGTLDFSAALSQLDNAYLGPKTAWIMNRQTLATLSGQLNKYGDIVRLVKYINGVPTIFGIPVKIAPSMDSIGASKVPVILGDFTYWATRLITADEGIGLKTFTEAPGLVENGLVEVRCFARADGALLWNDVVSPSPFVMIRNFS